MIRVHATRIVAPVQNELANRNGTASLSIRETMRSNFPAIRIADWKAIAISIEAPQPKPTT